MIRLVIALLFWGTPAFAGDAPKTQTKTLLSDYDKERLTVPGDINKDSFWLRKKEGYFWYKDPLKEKEKKEKKQAKKAKKPVETAKAKKPDFYIRPEFRDIPIVESTPKPLKELMGNPTVENAKKWLDFQARTVLRARLVGKAIGRAALKYGDEVYPDASPGHSVTSYARKLNKIKAARYTAAQLEDMQAVLLIFQGDLEHCVDCNVMGEYGNLLVNRGVNVVAVMPEGVPPHPRANYMSVVDKGGELTRQFDVHGSPPVVVAVFPEQEKFFTVARNVESPDNILLATLEIASEEGVMKPFVDSPRRQRLNQFLANLGGIDGKKEGAGRQGVVEKSAKDIETLVLKQGLGDAAGLVTE